MQDITQTQEPEVRVQKLDVLLLPFALPFSASDSRAHVNHVTALELVRHE